MSSSETISSSVIPTQRSIKGRQFITVQGLLELCQGIDPRYRDSVVLTSKGLVAGADMDHEHGELNLIDTLSR